MLRAKHEMQPGQQGQHVTTQTARGSNGAVRKQDDGSPLVPATLGWGWMEAGLGSAQRSFF